MALIKWKNDVHLEVVTDFDEASDVITTEDEYFFSGSLSGVDITPNDDGTVKIQFGTGAVAQSVNPSFFEIIKE